MHDKVFGIMLRQFGEKYLKLQMHAKLFFTTVLFCPFYLVGGFLANH